jgi:hypothetical protein
LVRTSKGLKGLRFFFLFFQWITVHFTITLFPIHSYYVGVAEPHHLFAALALLFRRQRLRLLPNSIASQLFQDQKNQHIGWGYFYNVYD